MWNDEPLLSYLQKKGLLNASEHAVVRQTALQTGQNASVTLLQLGLLDDMSLQASWATVANLPFVDEQDMAQVTEKTVPELGAIQQQLGMSWLLSQEVLPIRFFEGKGVLAVVSPPSLATLDALRMQCPRVLHWEIVLCCRRALLNAIHAVFSDADTVSRTLRDLSQPNAPENAVSACLEAILQEAVAWQVSDVHLSPEAGLLRVRYRLDGMLQPMYAVPKNHAAALLVRLKVLAALNIAEARAPQDGHFHWSVLGRVVDFRVSLFPTIHGENAVVRVLDRGKRLLDLVALGVPAAQQAVLHRWLHKPTGLILVSGPTGSGKTTSLYAMLHAINRADMNIVTLEDPVEYPLPWVRQTSINDTVKLDFAAAIRAVLRQDPDVLLLGEIRDADTAAMAVRAALTGHRVLATVHSPDAVSVLARLLDLEVPRQALAGQLVGVVAQRLVRRLCGHCRHPRAVDASERVLLALPLTIDPTPVMIYEPVGCVLCTNTGYRGRLPLLELLLMTTSLAAQWTAGASVQVLRDEWLASGGCSLMMAARQRVLAGDTSLTEARRVVDFDG